jgi:hypothetical protein
MGTKRRVAGAHVHDIHARVRLLVANCFPGFTVEFIGDPRGNIRRRTFGFRIVDDKGKYRTKTIWIGPSFYNRPNKRWLADQVKRASGTMPSQ